MPRDPFDAALCRQDGADLDWWDVDANPDQRTIAAWVCAACPAFAACAAAADRLGDAASGTWAGTWRPWVAPAPHADDVLAEFTALFGTTFDTGNTALWEGQMSLEELIG